MGVSEQAFREVFDSPEECLVAAFEAGRPDRVQGAGGVLGPNDAPDRTPRRADDANGALGLAGEARGAPELPIRATYRTTRVLRAIASAPGSSNREVADAAGLSDEGQTSKLLARLLQRGLVENVGRGHPWGEPNAWVLTSEGRRVLELLGDVGLGSARGAARRTSTAPAAAAGQGVSNKRPSTPAPRAPESMTNTRPQDRRSRRTRGHGTGTWASRAGAHPGRSTNTREEKE